MIIAREERFWIDPRTMGKEILVEPQMIDAFARLAGKGTSRRQLFRFALGALGGLALVRREAAAQDSCTAPFIYCDGMCVYSLTSNEHCGACNSACGDLVCVEGVCTACEEIGLTTCEDAIGGGLYCADLTNDLNCGACGNLCTTGPCVDGMCTSTVDCEPGFTECWGQCVDLQTDTFHCGTCFIQCAGEAGPGESSIGVCVAGECQVTCLPDYTMCGERCFDLSSDPANCGACGAACASGSCVDGTCGDSGSTDDTDGGDTSATTLPATGSGATGVSEDPFLKQAPVIGGAAVLAAAGLRWLGRQTTDPGSTPPA